MREQLKPVSAALDQARNVSLIIQNSLASIRENINDLRDRRTEILRRPVDVDTALERAELWAIRRVEEAKSAVSGPSFFSLPSAVYSGAWRPPGSAENEVLAYLGETFIAAVKRDILQSYASGHGITEEERQTLLDQNDAEILDAELAEEAIIRHAEAQGFAVDRREDADPRAVLAHESALP